MGHTHVRLWNEILKKDSHIVDTFNPVMHKKYLTTAAKFPHHRIADNPFIKGGNECTDRKAVHRRGFYSTQIPETDVRLEEALCANNHVNRTIGKGVYDRGLFLRRAKPAQHLHMHRKRGKPLGKGLVMLLGQEGRRNKHGGLFPVQDRLTGRPDGNLCLSISHISANQPVHGPSGFHVSFYIIDSGKLVRGFFIFKGGLKLLYEGGGVWRTRS